LVYGLPGLPTSSREKAEKDGPAHLPKCPPNALETV
jgi:hypothetical protein